MLIGSGYAIDFIYAINDDFMAMSKTIFNIFNNQISSPTPLLDHFNKVVTIS